MKKIYVDVEGHFEYNPRLSEDQKDHVRELEYFLEDHELCDWIDHIGNSCEFWGESLPYEENILLKYHLNDFIPYLVSGYIEYIDGDQNKWTFTLENHKWIKTKELT